MAGVNKVILVGNLGADPELRVDAERRRSGEPASRHIRNLEGPRRQPPGTDRMAPRRHLQPEPRRVAKNYLRKGSKVYLEGQIQTRKWTDQGGKERYSTEVVLQNFRGELVLLDSREGGGGGGRGAFNEDFGGDDVGGGAPQRSQSRPQPAAFDTDLDDDVPF